MSKEPRHVFTLRLRDSDTYRMLKLAAKHRRVSMNDIAQEALEEHLRAEATSLEEQLSEALEVVRGYTNQDRERDIAAFAHAEVSQEDPLRTTKAMADDDPFGVRDAFVRTLE